VHANTVEKLKSRDRSKASVSNFIKLIAKATVYYKSKLLGYNQ